MDELSKNIKLWLTYDNKISEINSYNKNLKDKKNILEKEIINTLKTNNLENKEIKINNIKLNINTSSTPSSLSIKLVENALNHYVDEYTKNKILNHIKYLRNNDKKNTISLKKKIIKNKSFKNKS